MRLNELSHEKRKMIENGEYHNYGKEYFNIIFKKLTEGLTETSPVRLTEV